MSRNFATSHDYTIVHKGTPVVFVQSSVIDQNGHSKKQLFYCVYDPNKEKQPDKIAPENLVELPFPNQVRCNGMQLVTLNNEALSSNAAFTDPGTWMFISDDTYIYLFRALSTNNTDTNQTTVYANRYLLVPEPDPTEGGKTNYRLIPKREARYQISGLKDTPATPLDKPGYEDLDGNFFEEPCLMLSMIKPHDGWFTVLLTPSDAGSTRRWLFFTANTMPDGNNVGVTVQSFLRGSDGWPDLRSGTSVAGPFELSGQKAPWDPGVLTPLGQPTSVYFRRQENNAPDPDKSGITSPRVMLSSRARHSDGTNKLICMDFALGSTGAPVILTDKTPSGNKELRLTHSNGALSFNGQSDYVTVSEELSETRKSFTFECWARLRGNSGTIVSRSVQGTENGHKENLSPGFSLTWDGKKKKIYATVHWVAGGGYSNTIESSVDAPSSGEWHHISFSSCLDPTSWSTEQHFIIGVQEGITKKVPLGYNGTATPFVQANGPAYLGCLSGKHPSDFFDGDIAEVRWWNSVRTYEEIIKYLNEPIEHPESEQDLVGYWKMDTPDSGSSTTAHDSSSYHNDGTIVGATWIENQSALIGMSSGMGVLGNTFTGSSTFADPILLNGADGRIHLYLTTDTDFGVLQYDTTVSRAIYTLPWKTAGTAASDGTLSLAARDAGTDLNNGTGSTPVVQVTQTAGSASCLDVVFTTGPSLGVAETFTAVPSTLPEFAQIINGQASDDPLDPEVQRGDIPFYDYSGIRPTIAIPTSGTAPVLFVTSQNARAPSSLGLDKVTLKSRSSGNLDLTLNLSGRTPTSKLVVLGLSIPDLPADVSGFVGGLKNLDNSASITSGTIAVLDSGSGRLYFVLAGNPSTCTGTVTPGTQDPDICTVSVTIGNNSPSTWTNVPTEPAKFMQFMNTNANDFIVVGANLSQRIGSGTLKTETSVTQLAPFISIIGGLATGSISSGTLTPRASQRKTLTTGTATEYLANTWASVLFRALPYVTPESGAIADIQAVSGTLEHPGTSGQWVQPPSPTAGDFNKTQASISCSTPESSVLALTSDFTLETWVRSTRPTIARRTIFTVNNSNKNASFCLASSTSGASFDATVGLRGKSFSAKSLPDWDKESWHHICAVCTNNKAVNFDGKDGATANKSGDLSFTDAFSVDGRIELTDLPAAGHNYAILSKYDYSTQNGTFQVFISPTGQLVCTVWLKSGGVAKHYLYTSNSPSQKTGNGFTLDKATPYAFSVSVSLKTQEQTDSVDYKTTGSGKSKTATISNPKTSTTTTLTFNFTSTSIDNSESADSIEFVLTLNNNTKHAFNTCGTDIVIGTSTLHRGTDATSDKHGYLNGMLGGLRLWSRDISDDAGTLCSHPMTPSNLSDGLEADWRCYDGEGRQIKDLTGGYHATLDNPDMWVDARLSSHLDFFVDGIQLSDGINEKFLDFEQHPEQISLGFTKTKSGKHQDHLPGKMNELRLWNVARTADEIRDTRFTTLSGTETGLVGYWPMTAGSGATIQDHTGNGNDATLIDASDQDAFWWKAGSGEFDCPVSDEAPQITNLLGGPRTRYQTSPAASSTLLSPSAVEYGVLYKDSADVTRGEMKRLYTIPSSDTVIDTFRVGDTSLNFVGQAQSNPTLIGYIEGAPPVPSENLTRPYYTAASMYQTYSGVSAVKLTQDDSLTYSYSASKDTGFDSNFEIGFGLSLAAKMRAVEAPLGLGVNEQIASFDLKAGGKATFSYSLGWLEGAKTSIGTKHAITNSLSAGGNWEPSEAHIERRYGLNNTGYALVKSGVANVYAMRLERTNTLIGIQMQPDPTIREDYNIIHFPIDPHYTKQGTLDGMIGFTPDADYPDANQKRESYFKPHQAQDLEQQIEAYEANLEADYQAFDAGAKGRRQDVTNFTKGDPVSHPEDTIDTEEGSAYDWQNKRSKRNLVNTYVWTSSGGIFAEQEQTMASREESHAGTYSFEGQAGLSASFNGIVGAVGPYGDISALFGGHIKTKVEKSRTEGRDFALDITNNTEACLARWASGAAEPENGGSPTPGKVNAYRFKSFYLAPGRDHFKDFFDTVVDPNWLATSDTNAAFALRQAQASKNHVWRILHRVTYVSRVPPTFDQVPIDTNQPSERTTIDTEQNSLLIRLVQEQMQAETGSLPPLAQQVGEAVSMVLWGDPKKSIDPVLSTYIPWWADFIAAAQQDQNGQAAQDLQRIQGTALSYMKAYFNKTVG